MGELRVIQDFVRANYEFDECDDPAEVVSIVQYDAQSVKFMANESAYKNIVQSGDWFIRDAVNETGCLVRVINGDVEELWSTP